MNDQRNHNAVMARQHQLSKLPPELLLNIMSYLPARDIARLRMTKRTFHLVVAAFEPSICGTRINQELSRIVSEIDYADLHGLPFYIAIRRFFTIFGRSRTRSDHFLSPRISIEDISDLFAAVYLEQNPDADGNWIWKVTDNVLQIDGWLQSLRLDSRSFPLGSDRSHRIREALLDALDETMVPEARHNKLITLVSHRWNCGTSPWMLELFEGMHQAPILPRVGCNWRIAPHRSDVQDEKQLFALPRPVQNQIDPRRRVSRFGVGLVTRHQWANTIAARYESGTAERIYDLGWLALLEVVEVIWL